MPWRVGAHPIDCNDDIGLVSSAAAARGGGDGESEQEMRWGDGGPSPADIRFRPVNFTRIHPKSISTPTHGHYLMMGCPKCIRNFCVCPIIQEAHGSEGDRAAPRPPPRSGIPSAAAACQIASPTQGSLLTVSSPLCILCPVFMSNL